MATEKKKRVSKKNKKSWRKHVDVTDVEKFLEDKRLEERLGGSFVNKKDDELFTIDTQGGEVKLSDTKKIYNVADRGVGLKRSLRLKETETPKCFSILERRSAVPDPIVKRNTVKNIPGRVHPRKLQAIAERQAQGKLTWKEKEAKRNREVAAERREKENLKREFNRDIWATESTERDLGGCAEWLSNDTLRHTLHNTGKRRKSIPKMILKKSSVLPAVESPHPGTSYNPSAKEHVDLLKAVAEHEAEIVRKEKHIDRTTTKMFSKVPRHIVEKEWITEMSAGLKVESDESEVEGEYKTVNPPVKNKKKTLQKRRKLREAKELREKLKKTKIEKKKISDVYKLRQFNEKIKKMEVKGENMAVKKKEMKAKKVLKTKLLGQVRYSEPELDFNLADELKGNLRGVAPQGSLLTDRFKSLQKRNILAPTLKRHVKKRPAKKYEKPNSKMGWEPKGY